MRVQQSAIDIRRWGEALLVGRLLEAPLMIGVRWGAWALTLERCLAAAKVPDRGGPAPVPGALKPISIIGFETTKTKTRRRSRADG
jgi:hypothetical protein